MSRFVYFAERDDLIKIGCTSGSPRFRVKEIGGAHLIAWLRGGRKKEKELHNIFAAHSVGHEWFKDCPEIREFIATKARTPRRDIQVTVKFRISEAEHARVVRAARLDSRSIIHFARLAVLDAAAARHAKQEVNA